MQFPKKLQELNLYECQTLNNVPVDMHQQLVSIKQKLKCYIQKSYSADA